MPDDLETEIKVTAERATANGWDARGVATLVTALVSLLLALAGIFRPETSARKVYDASSQADTKLSDDLKAQHEDIANLQAYLQKEHTDPAPVMIVARDSGTIVKPPPDAGPLVAVVMRRAPPPTSSARAVGFKPPPYENVTGTSDTTLRAP